MKKIAVLGNKGMAGHVIHQYLETLPGYEVWGIARDQQDAERIIRCDVSDTAQLEKILREQQFDVVINCIGILNQTAEKNPHLAVWINAYLPHFLQHLGTGLDYKLIHISTDCVFSGKEGNYQENSFKNGIGYYAQSKALGEVINHKDLTFRTSIIGPELKRNGIGLFHWFMQQKGAVSGYSHAFWTGVTTIELAGAIHQAIEQDLTGLYHLVNGHKISKYELLKIFNHIFKNNETDITENPGYTVDKSLVNNRTDFNYPVKGYHDMVAGMKAWMQQYAFLYPHYTFK